MRKLLLLAGFLIVTAALPAGAVVPTTAHETAIETAITSAVSQNSHPPMLNPSLATLATPLGIYNAQGSSLQWKCDPQTVVALRTAPKPCWFGAIKGPTWVVFGDSNAGSWLPALDVAAKTLGVRLASFVYPGCTSRTVVSKFESVTISAPCSQFHSHLAAAVGALKPTVVISATLGEGFSGNASNVAAYAATWKATFDAVTASAPRAKRLLFETTPNTGGNSSIPVCLSQNKDLLSCSPHYYPGNYYSTNYWMYLQLTKNAAAASNATLVNVAQWFCQTGLKLMNECPAAIGSTLVYVDGDHISQVYMKQIAPALVDELKALGF